MENLYMFVVVIYNGVYAEEYVQDYGLTWDDCSWQVETFTGEGTPTCQFDEHAAEETEYDEWN